MQQTQERSRRPQPAELAGDTPTMRLFSLLELIAGKDEFVSLQSLAEETGTPKPTLHRMLQQLEGADLLVRQSDGRHYGTGARLRRLAEDLLLNATQYGARHAVLSALVDEIGEACNLTTLSGNEVIYLDRAETPEPLRFYLHPGSRVPAHCSASGKMLLSQFSPSQRHKLLGHTPLQRHTPKTIVDLNRFEQDLKRVRRDGYAIERGEVTPGFASIAAAVLDHAQHPIASVALTFTESGTDAAQQAAYARRVLDTAARLTRRMSGTGN